MKTNGRSFLLRLTSDFPDDLSSGVYTPELLDDIMGLLKGMGIGRMNWQYYGDT